MEETIRRSYTLTASDIDGHRRLRLSSLLSFLQNIATDHAEILGIGGDKMMQEYGAFWMMVRSYLTLRRPITIEDEVLTVHTWHRGVGKTAAVFRDFDIYAGEELVGEAVASWVMVDVAARRILKPSSLSAVVNSLRPEAVKDIIPAKVSMPGELAEAFRRPIWYSDTDINGHMNNTKYADVACDAIRYEGCADRFVSEMQISYLKESFPGDELGVWTATLGDDCFVRGVDEAEEARFEVRLGLSWV